MPCPSYGSILGSQTLAILSARPKKNVSSRLKALSRQADQLTDSPRGSGRDVAE